MYDISIAITRVARDFFFAKTDAERKRELRQAGVSPPLRLLSARYQQRRERSALPIEQPSLTNYAMSVEKKIKKKRGKEDSSRRRFSVVIPQLTLMNDLTKHRDRRRRRRGS